MKRTRTSPSNSKTKKIKNEELKNIVPNDSSNSSRTSGGISKHLLTPCKSVGLSRNFRKSLNVLLDNKQTSETSPNLNSSQGVGTQKKPVNEVATTDEKVTPKRKFEKEIHKVESVEKNDEKVTPKRKFEKEIHEVESIEKNDEKVTPKRKFEKEIHKVESIEKNDEKVTPKRKFEKEIHKVETIENNTTTNVVLVDSINKPTTDEIESSKKVEPPKLLKTCVNLVNTKVVPKENIKKDPKNDNNCNLSPDKKVTKVTKLKRSLSVSSKAGKNKSEQEDKSNVSNVLLKSHNSLDINTKCFESFENAMNINLKSVKSSTIPDSTQSSQSSIYSYKSDEDDDDFVDKTIIERKSYKKSLKYIKDKLDRSKSNKKNDKNTEIKENSEDVSSQSEKIQQKDIDDLNRRIALKQEKIKLLQKSPRRGLSGEDLEELILAWRDSCQKALGELLEVHNKRGTLGRNVNMEDLLKLLGIPHQLVRFDSDQMTFE